MSLIEQVERHECLCLYGGEYQFELINDSGGGLVIDIRIPYREFNGD